MEVLFSILGGIVTTGLFIVGFLLGYKIGKTNELPSIRKQREERKAEEKERQADEEEEKVINKLEKSIGNLDRYDGTEKGQEEIE